MHMRNEEADTCADDCMNVSRPVSRAQAHRLPVSKEREAFSTGEQTRGARGRCSLPAGRRRQCDVLQGRDWGAAHLWGDEHMYKDETDICCWLQVPKRLLSIFS